MAILIDEARWPWRGDRWAHLVSDRSLDELHRFAHTLGLRRVGFQGDHYDVPSALRSQAIGRGAEAVTSRELVRRLRAAGLRRPPAARPGRWHPVAELAAGRAAPVLVASHLRSAGPPGPAASVVAALEQVPADAWSRLTVTVLARPSEVAALVRSPGWLRIETTRADTSPPVVVHHHRADGTVVELIGVHA